jgi:hypothetical protein
MDYKCDVACVISPRDVIERSSPKVNVHKVVQPSNSTRRVDWSISFANYHNAQ